MAMATAAFMIAVSYGAYRQFNEAIVVSKAAKLVGSDIALTRSYAIQRRSNVSLVVNEASRFYVIRDTSGAVLGLREFDATTGLPLEVLDLKQTGDSLSFNSRGLLVTAPTVEIAVGRGNRERTVSVNALGRYDISEVQ